MNVESSIKNLKEQNQKLLCMIEKYELEIEDLKRSQSEYNDKERSLDEEKHLTNALLHALREGCLVLDNDLRIKSANESFFKISQVDANEVTGKLLYELGNHQWDIPQLRSLLEEILPGKKVINDYKIEHDFEGIGRRIFYLNARQIDIQQRILLAFEDVTDRMKVMEELNVAHDTLEDRVKKSATQIRRLVRMVAKSELEERRRISAILHDDLQQFLVAIQMNLNHIHWKTEKIDGNRELSDEILEMIKLSDKALEKTRYLTSDLNPSILKSNKLLELLHWLVSRFRTMHGLKVDLDVKDNFIIHNIELRVIILQVLRELLFNVVKHSGTNHAIIEVPLADQEMGFLVICVLDKGRGFKLNKDDTRDSVGLTNIIDQINLYGGELLIDSEPGEGTCMTIKIPVEDKAITIK